MQKIEKIILEKYKKDYNGVSFSATPIPEEKETPEQYAVRYYSWIHQHMGCPVRFQKAVPKDLPKELKEWAEADKRSKGLYIWGDVGVGKTHAMYALAKMIFANGIGVEVWNMGDFFDHIKSFFGQPYAEKWISDEFKKSKVMMYDDFGVEKTTEWTSEIVYRLINKRYELMLPTIISSNLSPEEFAEKYGIRVASRIVEMAGQNGIIKLSGADRRMK